MTKRFTVDEKGYFDKKAMRYVTVDYLMDLVNGQDQQIKGLKKENKEMNEQLTSIFNLIDDEMELCKKQYEDAPPEKEKILRERYSLADAIKEIMVANKKY